MTTSIPAAAPQEASSWVRWRVLVGAIVIQLILGTVYGYSIFWQPLESKMGLAQPQAKYAFAICILSFAVVMVVAGRVQDVLGPRIPAIIGAVLMGGGFLIAGLMNNPIVFYLAHAVFTGAATIIVLMIYHALFARLDPERYPIVRYIPMGIVAAAVVAGVVLGDQYVGQNPQRDRLFLLWATVGFMAGAGIGFAYVCPIAALVKWFPKHKGLVSGLAVAGFGMGAFIFSRPDLRFSADSYIQAHGIISLFTVHGIVCMVVVILGACLLRNPRGTALRTPTAESTWQDTLRRPAFWILWLMFFSGALAGLMVIGIVKPFVQGRLGSSADAITTAQIGATAVGVLAIFNALGRVLWGLTSDRIGRTPTFVIMFGIQAVVMFVLGTLQTKMALYVGAGLVGFNFGGNFALFPSACADLFGAKNLGANYGWLFTSYGIAGVAGIYAGNTAKDLTGGYTAAFVLAAVLCMISAALAVGLGMRQKRAAAA